MIRNFLPLCICLLALTACGTHRTAEKAQGTTTARKVLTADEQRRYNELFTAAVVEREAERYDVMFELLDRALAIDPDAPEAIFDMALLRMSMATAFDSTAVKQADSLLHRAAALDPTNVYYKQTLANYLIRGGKLDEPTTLYEQIATQKPNDTETLETLVRLYEAQGEYAKAITALDRLETLEGSDDSYTTEKIKNLVALNDTAKAIGIVNALRAENPGETNYDALMAFLLYSLHNTRGAYAVLDSVLAVNPCDDPATLAYASFYRTESPDSLYPEAVRRIITTEQHSDATRKKAITDYLRFTMREAPAATTDSMAVLHLMEEAITQPFADRELAEICAIYAFNLVEFDYSDLDVLGRNILRLVPEDNMRVRLALIYGASARGDFGTAVEQCREGIAYNPEYLPYYYFGASALYTDDRDDEAFEMVAKGIAQTDSVEEPYTQMAGQLFAFRGDLLHARGRNDEAFASYDRALELDSLNYLAMNNYAYYLALEGRELDRAEEMSRRTIEAEPENGTYLDTYAWVLYRQKKYRQAAIYMEEALKHTPADELTAGVLEHAGDICYRNGDDATALGYWKAALKASDDAGDTKRLRRKVERKRL